MLDARYWMLDAGYSILLQNIRNSLTEKKLWINLTGSTSSPFILACHFDVAHQLSGTAVPKDLATQWLTDMQSEMSIYLRLLAFYVCLLANIQVI